VAFIPTLVFGRLVQRNGTQFLKMTSWFDLFSFLVKWRFKGMNGTHFKGFQESN
jgi:hypothetical protein